MPLITPMFIQKAPSSFTFSLNFGTTLHLCLILSGYQRDLRRFRDHVGGEMSQQVDLSWILPRGDASLMDKY